MKKMFTKQNAQRAALFAAVAVMIGLTIAPEAFAGTNGQEFDDVWDTLKGWTEGSLGKIIAGSTILVGLVMGIARQSIMSFAVGLGGGIGLYNAPSIVENVLTGALPAAIEAANTAQVAVTNLPM